MNFVGVLFGGFFVRILRATGWIELYVRCVEGVVVVCFCWSRAPLRCRGLIGMDSPLANVLKNLY